MKNLSLTLIALVLFTSAIFGQHNLNDPRLKTRVTNSLELTNNTGEAIMVEFPGNSMAFDTRRKRQASDNTRLFQMNQKLEPAATRLIDIRSTIYWIRIYKYDEKGRRYVYKELSGTFQNGYCALKLE